MLLIEQDGKKMLRELGIRVPDGVLASLDEATKAFGILDWSHPWYVKAQVLQGRRGKSGLVRRVDTREELANVIATICGQLSTRPCAGLLCDPAIPHETEWLVSCDIEREQGVLRVNYSDQGGMGVARVSSALIRQEQDWQAVEVPGPIKEVLRAIHAAMTKYDALSIEVNPLAILEDGSCLALDAKVELDEAAWSRHPDWSELMLSLIHI